MAGQQSQYRLEGLYTGSGRLIGGSLTEKQTKDHKGNPIPPDKQSFFFMLAVPKTDPNIGGILNQLHQMASGHYQQAPMVMQQINMGLNAQNFAWKIEDGDTPRINQKTGAAEDRPAYWRGCFVFKFTTMFPIDCCNMQGQQINPGDIKMGDYAEVMFSSTPNGAIDHTAGIYLNPNALMFIAYGEEIKGGISAVSAFAGRQHQLPQGASTIPTSAGATPMPGQGMPAGNQPPNNAGQGGMPQAGQNGGGMGTGYPTNQPHTGILTGPAASGMPQQGGGGMPAASGGGMPAASGMPQQGGGGMPAASGMPGMGGGHGG